MHRRLVAVAAVALTTALAGAACGSSSKKSSSSSGAVGDVTTKGISKDRCDANKAAGKITYLSGFDFAAAAGIVEVSVADAKGYFKQMCLDVDLKSSFSTANYPLVAGGQAQFASGGSYSEILDFGQKNGVVFQAVTVAGKQGMDELLVKPDEGINSPADVKGKTIGVKGKITPSVKAMLLKAGLTEGTDYKTVLLDGFDPKVHIKQPVSGFPVYKSNEPGQLEKAGIPFKVFDPVADGIPGSFGVIFTSEKWAKEHPTAVQDFARAAMKGMEDAIADPAYAVKVSLDRIKAGGNKSFLSDEGETFRWQTESKMVTDSNKGKAIGAIDPAQLQAEIDALTQAGVFTTKPSIDGTYDPSIAKAIYGDATTVVWPSGS